MVDVLELLSTIALAFVASLVLDFFESKFSSARERKAMETAQRELESMAPMREEDLLLAAKLNRIARQTFGNDVASTVQSLTSEEQLERVETFIHQAADVLGVSITAVHYLDMSDGALTSWFDREDCSIALDVRLVVYPQYAAALIQSCLHELRHAYQWTIVNQLDNIACEQEQIAQWQYCFDNYIDAACDFELYYKQMIEIDARKFARIVMEGI